MTRYTLDLEDNELQLLKQLLTDFAAMGLVMVRAPIVISEERAEALRTQVEVATRLRGKLPV